MCLIKTFSPIDIRLKKKSIFTLIEIYQFNKEVKTSVISLTDSYTVHPLNTKKFVPDFNSVN